MSILKEVAGDILQDVVDIFDWKRSSRIKKTVRLQSKVVAAGHWVVAVGFDDV